MATYKLDRTSPNAPASILEHLVMVHAHVPQGAKTQIENAVLALQVTVAGTLNPTLKAHFAVEEVP